MVNSSLSFRFPVYALQMYLGVRLDREMDTEKTGIEEGKQLSIIGWMMWWGLNKTPWKFVRAATEPVGSRPVLGRPGEVAAQCFVVVLSSYFHSQLPVHSWPSWCTSMGHQGTKPAVETPVLIAFFTFQWLPSPLEYISPERTPYTTEDSPFSHPVFCTLEVYTSTLKLFYPFCP